MAWFKTFALAFSLYYPETMYRTYVINAPMLFTGVWKAARKFIHPVTAAKISDGIVLFSGSISTSLKPWRSLASSLAETDDLAILRACCYAPPEDVAAVAALRISRA
eukprot:836678-Prymnesium_polylepis.2